MEKLKNKIIFIIGPRKLQNESIARFIEKETAARCYTCSGEDFTSEKIDQLNCDGPLFLIDLPKIEIEGFLANLKSLSEGTLPLKHIALFNLKPDSGIEEKVITWEVRGLFYENDSLDQLLKGIRAIFNGEFWISREVMARCLQRKRETERGGKFALMLTHREVEILNIICKGASNDEIADRLFISPHTVKTHIYNIFKKIKVPNRFQAALWAARNL